MNNALQKTLTAGLMHGLVLLDKVSGKNINLDEFYEHWIPEEFHKKLGYKTGLGQAMNDSNLKPYLFPMSALTKEIEFKGERFAPYIELLRICNFDVDNMSDEELNHYKDNCRDIELMMFFEVEKLIEWHFNVFGLSPEEFIEVNETNNPYAV